MAGYIDFLNQKREQSAKAARSVPKNETLAEHLQHCTAKPGECPFLKKAMEADTLPLPGNGGVNPLAYERLAAAMTGLQGLSDQIMSSAGEDDKPAVNAAKAIAEGLACMSEVLTNAGCTVGTEADGENDEETKVVIVPPVEEGAN